MAAKYNSDIPFSKAEKGKIEDYRSRTLACSLLATNRKSTKRSIKNKENINFSNKTKNKIPDCKIYFPAKGLVGKVESQYRNKPKFIIVPKERYIQMHPEYTHSRQGSPTRLSSAKRTLKGTIREYSSEGSQVEYSSPVRAPKRTILEKAKNGQRTRYQTRERTIGFKREKSKNSSIELRRSLRTRTRDARLRIYKPLIKKKAKHAQNFLKKHSMKVRGLNYVPTDATLNEYQYRNRDLNIESKMDKSSNISSGYGDITKIIKNGKKTRIQSAHPVMTKKETLTTSFTFSSKPAATSARK